MAGEGACTRPPTHSLRARLFGEKEEIVGYDGLSIDIWLTPQFQVRPTPRPRVDCAATHAVHMRALLLRHHRNAGSMRSLRPGKGQMYTAHAVSCLRPRRAGLHRRGHGGQGPRRHAAARALPGQRHAVAAFVSNGRSTAPGRPPAAPKLQLVLLIAPTVCPPAPCASRKLSLPASSSRRKTSTRRCRWACRPPER